jgi:hypothetical protein
MVQYDSPSEQGQNATAAESNEGQTLPVSGTEQATGTANEALPAGVNPNSPEYRHFQSVADRRIAEMQNQTKSEMAKFQAQIQQLQAKLSAQEIARQQPAQQQSPDNSYGLQLDFQQAPKLALPEGAYLDEATASAVDRVINDRIQWTIAQIQQQQAAAIQQAQAQQAEQQLVGFAQGLDQAKQVEFVGLVRQYEPIARQDPAAFLKFAETQLGLNQAPKEAAPAPVKLVQPQQPIPSQRPTNNGGVSPRRNANETLEEIVRRNVRKAHGQ